MKIIEGKNINEIRKQIDKAYKETWKKENKEQDKTIKEKIIVKAQNPKLNRQILENKKTDILLGPELTGKDKLKQRGSGLNEVLCKIAAKNNISIAINLDELLKKQDIEKAIILARIKQNIMLCKKTKANLIIFSQQKHDKKAIFSLLLNLEASTSQAKYAIEKGYFLKQ
jgi:RNase P/RNase MRP subunit p30